MFPPLEAGCDHQAGEEHALMHRCQILKSKILIQFFIQDARTGETSWNLIVLKPRYYKHMQQEPFHQSCFLLLQPLPNHSTSSAFKCAAPFEIYSASSAAEALAISHVSCEATSAPPVSLRDLVKGDDEQEDEQKSAREAERSHVWREAQTLGKKYVQLGLWQGRTMDSLATLFAKSPAKNFEGVLNDSHQAFVFSSDL